MSKTDSTGEDFPATKKRRKINTRVESYQDLIEKPHCSDSDMANKPHKNKNKPSDDRKNTVKTFRGLEKPHQCDNDKGNNKRKQNRTSDHEKTPSIESNLDLIEKPHRSDNDMTNKHKNKNKPSDLRKNTGENPQETSEPSRNTVSSKIADKMKTEKCRKASFLSLVPQELHIAVPKLKKFLFHVTNETCSRKICKKAALYPKGINELLRHLKTVVEYNLKDMSNRLSHERRFIIWMDSLIGRMNEELSKNNTEECSLLTLKENEKHSSVDIRFGSVCKDEPKSVVDNINKDYEVNDPLKVGDRFCPKKRNDGKMNSRHKAGKYDCPEDSKPFKRFQNKGSVITKNMKYRKKTVDSAALGQQKKAMKGENVYTCKESKEQHQIIRRSLLQQKSQVNIYSGDPVDSNILQSDRPATLEGDNKKMDTEGSRLEKDLDKDISVLHGNASRRYSKKEIVVNMTRNLSDGLKLIRQINDLRKAPTLPQIENEDFQRENQETKNQDETLKMIFKVESGINDGIPVKRNLIDEQGSGVRRADDLEMEKQARGIESAIHERSDPWALTSIIKQEVDPHSLINLTGSNVQTIVRPKQQKKGRCFSTLSPGLHAAIRCSKGILKSAHLKAFLTHVRGKVHVVQISKIYSREVNPIIEQLEKIIKQQHLRMKAKSITSKEIIWLKELIRRLKAHENCNSCVDNYNLSLL